MKSILVSLILSLVPFAHAQSDLTCKSMRKSTRSCIEFNDGDEARCQVLKEGQSCFTALNGEDREKCEREEYPADHYFWAR